jgi:hypothetical protein
MPTSLFRAAFKYAWLVLAFVLAQSTSLVAQQTFLVASMNTAAVEPVPAAVSFVSLPPEAPRPHRFWDNENRALFATVAAFGAADFYVTRANLASGGRELNPVTRLLSGSTPGLAVNFSLETASVIGISYIFHKTGHHKLERMTSVFNIGASGAAVGYDLAHR